MYKSIFKLQRMLEKANVQYKMRDAYDGYQIIIYLENKEKLSAVQHDFSYGHEDDLIEIMGGLTEQEEEGDNVLGYLTAKEVFERFKYCYDHQTTIYKKEKK